MVAPAAEVAGLRQLIRLNVKAPLANELCDRQRNRNLLPIATS